MDIIETIKSFFGGNKVEIIDNIEFRGKEIKALHRYKEKLNERLSVTKLYIREKDIESEEVKVNLLNKTRIIAILYCFNTELELAKLKCVDEIIRAMDDEVFLNYIEELKECNSIGITEDNKVILKHITKFLHYNSIDFSKENSIEKENQEEKSAEVEIKKEVEETKKSENSDENKANEIKDIKNENVESIEVKNDNIDSADEKVINDEESINKDNIKKEEENTDKKETVKKEEKSEKKENKNSTKLKEENEEIKDKILIALKNKNDFITIKEIREDEYNLGLSECTSQKISALIRQLVEEGKVERVSEKKVIKFKIK
ncbi:hypothetical protein CM240_0873 [Clostridium bornimense]|uniref:Uncharacterized protein n=1 Tax=Clostridium bornimense TaxID=1216932 RepID=W6S174_9CLOT|nr:hypothetical protein [Clostridium bornimense]CDM68037.1 hypothetical protein CM240_0873 [Clostridium bornimense]